jgi:hypothetical protein
MIDGEPEAAPYADGFVPIAIVYSLPEAGVLVATLQAYGIAVIARNQGTVSVNPPWILALGGIAIAVARGQHADSIALLEEIDGGWTVPPNAWTDNHLANCALSVAMAAFAGAIPPPRRKGRYAWRSGLAVHEESAVHEEPTAQD